MVRFGEKAEHCSAFLFLNIPSKVRSILESTTLESKRMLSKKHGWKNSSISMRAPISISQVYGTTWRKVTRHLHRFVGLSSIKCISTQLLGSSSKTF